MKIALLAGAVLLGVVVVVIGVLILLGSRLPKHHVASRRVQLRRPPAEVHATVRDVVRAPEWRRDVQRVEMLEPHAGRVRFREHGSHGPITMEVAEDVPPATLVTRIADDSLPFAGTWTYELRPGGDGGTLVTITERGEVKTALFRALSHYVFTHHRTIDGYLRALGRRFGEDVTVQDARDDAR